MRKTIFSRIDSNDRAGCRICNWMCNHRDIFAAAELIAKSNAQGCKKVGIKSHAYYEKVIV